MGRAECARGRVAGGGAGGRLAAGVDVVGLLGVVPMTSTRRSKRTRCSDELLLFRPGVSDGGGGGGGAFEFIGDIEGVEVAERETEGEPERDTGAGAGFTTPALPLSQASPSTTGLGSSSGKVICILGSSSTKLLVLRGLGGRAFSLRDSERGALAKLARPHCGWNMASSRRRVCASSHQTREPVAGRGSDMVYGSGKCFIRWSAGVVVKTDDK